MSAEVNQQLGLKFSWDSRISVNHADWNRSLIHIDVKSGSAILLMGDYSPYAERLNQVALPILLAGINTLDPATPHIDVRMRDLFIQASAEVDKAREKTLGISATAIMIPEAGRAGSLVFFAHIGKNRLYTLDFSQRYDLYTIDAGYYYEGRVCHHSQEDLVRFMALDYLAREEDLNKSESYRRDILWKKMLDLPSQYLGQINQDGLQYGYRGITAGGKLLISSVGVHRSLTAPEIIEILNKEQDPASVLVEKARERSVQKHFRAAPDHEYSAIVVEKL